MDPNANLKELRSICLIMTRDHDDPESNGIDQDDANRAAELFLALDNWIRQGGFMPDAWARESPNPGEHSAILNALIKEGK